MKPGDNKKSFPGNVSFPALFGFAAGVIGSAAYLLLGGEYLWRVPLWATVVFYPGFVVGNWAYDHCHVSVLVAQVIGVLAVGLAYALMAALARWIWLAVSRRRNKSVQNDDHNSSQI
jgi:hypothetical protein